ncbi:MAG: 30S ribosomal protein S7 [Candidatus Roizmanbacteria bacterium]|nr:MAG: 30S ribosomal protein S7 [Candidatus Roizmanbacteria bacterium]
MPRHPYKKRRQQVDVIYRNLEVSKLINYIMEDGKKSVAESIVYQALEILKKEGEPLKLLHKALNNVSPNFEVKPRRLGGASYLVPSEVRKERKLYLALNWIVDGARSRSQKEYHNFKDKLSAEILDASKNQGAAVSKRSQVEKLAEANKAFAHLKW